MPTTPHATAALILAVAVTIALPGCASYLNAAPERKVFPFDGTTLNVQAPGVPTDLVEADRRGVLVTRRFDARSGAKHQQWRLADGTLELRAECGAIANCDARFRVEVPRGTRVLRAGRPTDLRGERR